MIEDEWFQTDYVPSFGYECDEKIYLDDVNAAFDVIEVSACTYEQMILSKGNSWLDLVASKHMNVLILEQDDAAETKMPKPSSFINAFKLIAMSHDLDLSGLFQEQASI